VAEKTWTKEELDLEVEKRVQEALDKASVSELTEKITSLETEKASLTEKVEELVKLLDEASLSINDKSDAFSTLEKEYSEFKTSVSNKELVRSRVRELAKIGYSVPDEDETDRFETFATKLLGMDENAFELMKELVAETIQSNSDNPNDTPNSDSKSEGSTSTEDDKDEDTLPVGKAHAEEISFEDKVRRIVGGVLTPTE